MCEQGVRRTTHFVTASLQPLLRSSVRSMLLLAPLSAYLRILCAPTGCLLFAERAECRQWSAAADFLPPLQKNGASSRPAIGTHQPRCQLSASGSSLARRRSLPGAQTSAPG